MKIKQVTAFIVSFLCMAVIICLTGAVVGNMISIGWYIGLAAAASIVLWISIDYLSNQISDGEWV